MLTLPLQCECGKIKGQLENFLPEQGNRVICYCNDCQKFAEVLHKAHRVLDDCGGTDIFQIPFSHIKITEGANLLKCLRLKPKGLYRWYAGCCETPIGNTLNAKMPFIGLVHTFIRRNQSVDDGLGPVKGYYLKKYATATLPEPIQKQPEFFLLMRVVVKLLKWKLTEKTQPNPFFTPDGKSIVPPRLISEEE